jgi:hypothetical protein
VMATRNTKRNCRGTFSRRGIESGPRTDWLYEVCNAGLVDTLSTHDDELCRWGSRAALWPTWIRLPKAIADELLKTSTS